MVRVRSGVLAHLKVEIPAHMTHTRCLLLLMTWLGAGLLHAQVGVLKGRLLDAVSELPVQGAHIRTTASGGTISDAKGEYTIPIDTGSTDSLFIGHLSYVPVARPVPALVHGGGGSVIIKLQPRTYSIPEVQVTQARAEVVYRHATLNVGNYVVSNEGVWVLVYDRPQLWHPEQEAGMRELKRARLHLLDTLFKERSSLDMPEHVRTMHVDHRGDPVLEGVGQAWVPVSSGGRVHVEPIPLNTLHEAVLPWTDTVPGWLLGNDRREDYPAFNHFAFDPSTRTTFPICSVVDEGTLQLFRSQYKYMDGRSKVVAMNMERKLGVDKEIIAGYMTGFHHDRYFHVPYAPLWVVQDTLCVFDHERGVIRRSTLKSEALMEVPIAYHKDQRWASLLLFDRELEQVHVVMRKGSRTHLRKLDVRTGTLSEPYILEHAYTAELQVHDGHVYYTYRPGGAWEQRTLYREELR